MVPENALGEAVAGREGFGRERALQAMDRRPMSAILRHITGAWMILRTMLPKGYAQINRILEMS
ncbi:hypothetical protein [Roseomonas indoligenes]|uniref:Uncharacterized protein n=1 Tax=Roseomonas indoligenes TaxID=2820811 RepID=A0A940N6E3_9PROT|nr:hypothetical protein [Pararoseomonas indoligenes]MBP0494977.1 hypothetical protein [Pararoseomonas indoligenes]